MNVAILPIRSGPADPALHRLVLRGLLTAALVGGCYAGAGRPFSPVTFEREPGWVSVASVPVVHQRGEHDCGGAVAAMLLSYWGQTATEADVRAASSAAPDKGLRAEFLRAYLRGRGFEAFLFEGTFGDFERELESGRPVVVGVHTPYSNRTYAHYQLVVGMNRARKLLVVIDPAKGWRVYPFDGFAAEWKPAHYLTLAVSPGEG